MDLTSPFDARRKDKAHRYDETTTVLCMHLQNINGLRIIFVDNINYSGS